MARGRLITLEGGEGTGKSTQARRLCDTLSARGIATVLTREPGGTPLGEEIRRLILSQKTAAPETELLLFAAARIEHLAQVIRPALERGAWVVCDRYIDSTRVYQGMLAHIGPALIDSIERSTLRPGDLPDVTFILDLAPEIGSRRSHERGEVNRYDASDIGDHRVIREGFLAIARTEPDRCAVIDAARDPDAVTAAILAELDRRLPADAS